MRKEKKDKKTKIKINLFRNIFIYYNLRRYKYNYIYNIYNE